MWTKAKALQLDFATIKWSSASSVSSILQVEKKKRVNEVINVHIYRL